MYMYASMVFLYILRIYLPLVLRIAIAVQNVLKSHLGFQACMPPQNAPVWVVALSVLGDLVLRQARDRQPAPTCGCSIEEEPRELELCRVDAVRSAERIGRVETELAIARKSPSPAPTISTTTTTTHHLLLCAIPGLVSFIGQLATYCRAKRPGRRAPVVADKVDSSTDDEVLAARSSARSLCR